jgi:hypothetical protein
MNDDQIRSELERRAGSAAQQTDWAKRVLLPAVWREVDARPEPVVTSRWSTGVSVAALVTALLVLVVAVPRLAPNGSASPTPIAPLVLSATDFAAQLAAGSLNGQTVLVDGQITADPDLIGYCVPTHACYFGALGGTEPIVNVSVVDVATVQEDANASMRGLGTWPWWRTFRAPVDGVLLLSVDSSGAVEFRGVARDSGTGPAWSVADAAALDIATFSPDDALIVRGRLYSPVPPGTVYDRTCPGGRPFDGLPSRFCGNFDSLSTATPGGDRIEVQAGAANEFDNEGEALYAIAPRLYGSCVGTPPCWLWDVVARIAEGAELQPTPMPTTPTPAPMKEGTQTHACRWDADESGVTAIDHSGLIVGCSVRLVPLHPIPVPVVSSDEAGNLLVKWQVSADCPADESIEFWGPIEGRPQLADYMLRVAGTNTGGTSCAQPNASRVAFLTLSETVDDEAVRAFLTIDGRGVYASRDLGVVLPQVTLAIAPSKPYYSEGEAVHVTTSVWAETDFTVPCLYSYGIFVEQLDGPISFHPDPVAGPCPGPVDLRAAEPVMADALAAWGQSGPSPLAPWLRDDELYLPRGTYLFSTHWFFDPPETSEFRGRTQLEAFVVVTVR